jgi:hypothetical protein
MPIANTLARRAIAALAALGFAALGPLSAQALDEKANEKEKLKACEQSICQIILDKKAAGDLKCDLSKTWAKKAIEGGIEKKKISWGFGDARCGVELGLSAGAIVDALTKPEASVEIPKHTVKCEVEREKEVTPINVTLAPKITFKGGKAQKAWLNVSDIEAPAVVKGAIWTAAKLEDTLGVFHGEMIEEINEFVHEKCAKRYAKQ